MGNWEDVVDLQDETIRFWMSRTGQEYGRGFGESMIASMLRDPSIKERANEAGWKVEDAADDTQWLRHLPELMAKSLMMAEPIYVNEEVHRLIEAAREGWKPEPIKTQDVFPTMYGFMVFPKPFIAIDVHGKRLSFRALCWTPIQEGTNKISQGMQTLAPAESGGVLLSGYTMKGDIDDYPFTDQFPEGVREPKLSLCYITPYHFGEKPPVDVNGSGLNEFLNTVQVAWRLAKQTITVPSEQRLPKHFRKRAVRSGLSPNVTLIKLRQVSASKPDGVTEVEWQSRWIVRGHWHTYHYKDGRTEQIWITPYIKGPEDKPLRIKPLRAFEFTR